VKETGEEEAGDECESGAAEPHAVQPSVRHEGVS
jgi:hypothetical protein